MSIISSVMLFFVYIYALVNFRYIRTSSTFLLIFSLFSFRIILSLNHELTFEKIIFGQSINSFFSMLSVLLMLCVVSRRFVRHKLSIPIFMLVCSVFLSGLISGYYVGAANAFMKWMLMFAIVSCLLDVLDRFGIEQVLKPFGYIFLCILLAQFLSLVFGQSKNTESLISPSTAISYIAGYAHESAFSMLLFMGMFVFSILAFYKKISAIFPLLFFVGLILANYRTVILAAITPLSLLYFSVFYLGSGRDFKVAVFSCFCLLIVSFFAAFSEGIASRFGELVTVFFGISELISIDFSSFSVEEKRLLSSRLYIWNMYLTNFEEFNVILKLLGAGPSSWMNYFSVYAHNSYVGILFEQGFLGLISLTMLFIFSFYFSFKCHVQKLRVVLIGYLLGFFVMSNSTMPFWAVEGIYFFSFVVAIIVWFNRGYNMKFDGCSHNVVL